MQIIWNHSNPELSQELINQNSNQLICNFPIDFLNIIRYNDGGYPKPNRFLINKKEEVFNNLLSFYPNDESYIIETFKTVKNRLIEKIIPFGEDPFGNLLCFDYREGKNKSPKIVFWDHEKVENSEKAIYYICDSFTELLEKLYNPDEDK